MTNMYDFPTVAAHSAPLLTPWKPHTMTPPAAFLLIGVIELIGISPQVSQLQYEVGLKSDLIRVLNQQMNSESNEDLTAITNATYSHFQPIERKWNSDVKGGAECLFFLFFFFCEHDSFCVHHYSPACVNL